MGRLTTTKCLDHAYFCVEEAAVAPPYLAEELERLAAIWLQLAKGATDPAPTNIIPLERLGQAVSSSGFTPTQRKV